jgi:hypothetical protein
MWVQRAVCRLVARNVGSLAAIVSQTCSLLAPNVSRKSPLFAGSDATVCKPLQLRLDGPTRDKLDDLSTLFDQSAAEIIRQLIGQAKPEDFG